MKKNILNYTLDELRNEISNLSEEKFRADQIFQALHGKRIKCFDEISNISSTLKDKLKSHFFIDTITTKFISQSEKDNTKKFLFEIFKNNSEKKEKYNIEAVLISEDKRNTICLSSQVGCNVGCEFCATGKMGFLKNLEPSQIILQVYEIIKLTGIIPTNLVYMGMGEPFLNYDNVISSIKILASSEGLNISSRRITVSTVGFKNRIKKFADDLMDENNKSIKNVKLALSLHSTDNGIRESIIPTSKKNKLTEIYDELIYFYRKTKNKVTYEYIYFDGLNNTKDDIKRLTKLGKMIPSNINIIPFHPIDFKLNKPLDIFNSKTDIDKSLLNKKIIDFIGTLRKNDLVVNLRSSSGVDINAACGQLAIRDKNMYNR